MKIDFFNRYTQSMETEQVYGEGFLRWIYETSLGKVSLHALVKRAVFSKWYGWRMNRAKSRARVAPFVAKYGLDPNDYIAPKGGFTSFNDFFYRKLKPAARPIFDDPNVAVFPADGRHFGFQDVSQMSGFYVKGQRFDLTRLLGSAKLAEQFAKGSLIFSRLCPVDYHRYHFPVAGIPGEAKMLNGSLFSVNPIALQQQLAYLWENKRALTEIESPRFGKGLYLEVGATCVGSMVETYQPNQAMQRGDEKGYFRFGGSTTILMFEPGKVTLDSDLIEWTKKQTEVYAHMGDSLGKAVSHI